MPRTRLPKKGEPSVAIVGAGNLANFLAPALRASGFAIREIIVGDSAKSHRRGRALAAKVKAQVATAGTAALDATLLWFCVPDREIRNAGKGIAENLEERRKAMNKNKQTVRYAFHSSGALLSGELAPLQKAGVQLAAVHPLMTFVAAAHPSLTGVPFAIEGDRAAAREARRIVQALGGESFSLPARRKAAYHAWATMTSPLLVAFLVTLEDAARAAGLRREDARRHSLPIILQTMTNYSRLGPSRSFSGPLVRGDADTVAKHLAVFKKHPRAREVYVALARAALRALPVKNRTEIRRLLAK